MSPPNLPSRLTLSSNQITEIETIFHSVEFVILAGPASDCQIPAIIKPTDKIITERQKYVSNASSGYSSWMDLRFNLWDEEMDPDCVKALTSLSLLELTTARDYFRSTIRFFEPFIRDDGTRVGSINLLYQHLVAVYQFFHQDAKMEYLLMETLLMLLLQIPSLNTNLIQRIILELCTQSNTIPPILATCELLSSLSLSSFFIHLASLSVSVSVIVFSAVYELIPALDVSTWRELSNTLAIHLSNTHLQWPYWQYWSEEYSTLIESSDYSTNGSSQTLFLELLIGQCTRLSLSERMMKTLPQAFHSVIPKDEFDYAPKCSHYILQSGRCGGKGSLAHLAEQLFDRLSQRENLSSTELIEWLLESSHEGVDDNFQQQGWRLTLFIECLLCRGAITGGTISGMIGLVDRQVFPSSDFIIISPSSQGTMKRS
jgi:hypothetical protein